MNLVLIASASFMLALSGALVPGPLFTLTVSESVKRGFRAGPMIIIGHGLLELATVVFLVSGAAPYLSRMGARFFVGIAGGAILIVMGFALLKQAGGSRLEITPGSEQTGLHPVVIGIVGSISNPYWVIWWLTIGLGYLLSSMQYGLPGILAFFIGHISADLLWYSMVSLAASKGRRVIGEKGYRIMLYGCGAFLICFGVWFISGALKS